MDFNNFLFQLNQDNILNAVSNDFSVRQVMFSNHFDQMSLYLSISFTERFFSPRQDPPCPPRLQSSEVSISLHPHYPLPHHQRRRRHKDTGGTQRHRRNTKTQEGHKDTGGTQRHRRDTKTQGHNVKLLNIVKSGQNSAFVEDFFTFMENR